MSEFGTHCGADLAQVRQSWCADKVRSGVADALLWQDLATEVTKRLYPIDSLDDESASSVRPSSTDDFLRIVQEYETAFGRIDLRLLGAGFEETCRLEDFDWTAAITLDRRLLDAVFSLEFLAKHEHVLLVGPAGVGKSFLAQAMVYAAVRAGYTVRFVHADDFFKAMAQPRVDNSVDRTLRSFLSPDLIILDDLGLHRFTAQQSADIYELILNRHRASSFVITSNRAVDEWLSLFDDPILGNSALDRLANASYQIVGFSYRERQSPHRKLLGLKVTVQTGARWGLERMDCRAW